jgi:hypothetical protein
VRVGRRRESTKYRAQSTNGEAPGVGRLPRMARRRLRARVNWAVRWGGLSVSAAVGIAYLISWNTVYLYNGPIRNGNTQDTFCRGQIKIHAWSGAFPPASKAQTWWEATPLAQARQMGMPFAPFRFEWHWTSMPNGFRALNARLPLWPLLPLGIVTTILAAGRRDRPAGREDPCASCGYDRSGLSPDSACPECASKP